MTKYAYARVSHKDQNIEGQIKTLEEQNPDIITKEVISSVATKRPALDGLLNDLKKGDLLIVTRLDRLGRSLIDVVNKIDLILSREASVTFCEQGLILTSDKSNSTSKMIIQMLAMIAEFELSIRRERQREGIEVAKRQGKFKGTKPKYGAEKLELINKLITGEKPMSINKACDAVGISKKTYYNLLKRHPEYCIH